MLLVLLILVGDMCQPEMAYNRIFVSACIVE